jgi:hypothetical protein
VSYANPGVLSGAWVMGTLLILAAVAGFGGLGAQVYRWRQDVLYGPYIRREERHGSITG